MKIAAIRTDGLGDSTYLLEHEGVGVVVDPQRDVERFEQAISDSGADVTYVLETHIHNDYVSGGRELARRAGARLVLPAAAGVAFDHVPAFHNEDLEADELLIRPVHTPGHTPEHTSYVVLLDGVPAAVFSGGSLLVGAAGRSDLPGDDRAEQLARLQYISVHRLAGLPDGTALLPTHGAGSFCTATAADGRATSTIGMEKRTSHPALAYPDADSFVAGQLGGLQPFPSYYRYMGPINLMGPDPMPVPELEMCDPSELPADAAVVDIRPRHAYSAGHIPGSLGIEMSDSVAVWAGWLLPFNCPVVLLAERGQDVGEVVRQFGRIGFDRVIGVIYELDGWLAAGGAPASFESRSPRELADAIAGGLDPRQVLDVRSPAEWDAGHIEGSLYRYVPDLVDVLPAEIDRSRPLWVVCGSGYRALAAAAFLEAEGIELIAVTPGGVPDALMHLGG